MLYLGQADGRRFVRSAAGGFFPEAGGGKQRAFTVLIPDLPVKNAAGVSWLNRLQCAKVTEPAP